MHGDVMGVRSHPFHVAWDQLSEKEKAQIIDRLKTLIRDVAVCKGVLKPFMESDTLSFLWKENTLDQMSWLQLPPAARTLMIDLWHPTRQDFSHFSLVAATLQQNIDDALNDAQRN